MENSLLLKVDACFLMQGDNIVDFWVNKHYENGEVTEDFFETHTAMLIEVLRCINQGAVFRIEIYEA